MDSTGFRYEFYNAGSRIDELMRFSISPSSAGFNNESADQQSVGFWSLNARAESFFDVPADISSGNEVIRVNFADDIKRRFGRRGVVLIDPRWLPEKEDPDKDVSEYPVAPTKEAAVERGNQIWQLYLRSIVDAHITDCQNAKAAGGAPRSATGFTKKALKLLDIPDPGDQHWENMKAGKAASSASNELLAEMQRSNQAVLAIVLALASGQKIDPELIKAIMPTPGAVPAAMPSTSGIATGEIKKPIVYDAKKSGLDGVPVEAKPGQVGLDAYDRKTQGKKDRATEAAKELTTK